jgi:hypothetical protein
MTSRIRSTARDGTVRTTAPPGRSCRTHASAHSRSESGGTCSSTASAVATSKRTRSGRSSGTDLVCFAPGLATDRSSPRRQRSRDPFRRPRQIAFQAVETMLRPRNRYRGPWHRAICVGAPWQCAIVAIADPRVSRARPQRENAVIQVVGRVHACLAVGPEDGERGGAVVVEHVGLGVRRRQDGHGNVIACGVAPGRVAPRTEERKRRSTLDRRRGQTR